MYCSNCGNEISTEAKFCPKCGAPMRWYTRIIGYLRAIDNFDNFRKIEAGTRVYTGKKEAI